MVAVGSRHVRLLTAGSGPGVLLLHGSPNTADALQPLIDELQRDFLVVAPDSPGNGASDPLTGRALGAEAYANALAGLLDALNLRVVAVYGFHSGAVFAAELARRHAARVSCVVCDGYPLWTDAEARELADGYLPPLVATPDGAHLAGVWSRVIEQNWYFPWHIRDADRWIDGGADDVDRLHTRALELLRAGDHYRGPYAPALEADGAARLEALTMPTLVTATPQDILGSHLERVPPHPRLTIRRVADATQTRRETRHWFRLHPPPVADAHFEASRRRFVDTGDGQLFVDGEPGATSVWFHDAGESSRQRPRTSAHTAALGVDLPGHGLSAMAWPEDSKESLVALRDALAAAGVELDQCGFGGKGLGRQVAELLAGRSRRFESRAVDVPDIEPRWDGAHLLAAWHFARFRTLYSRWSQRGPGTRSREPLPSAEVLHQKALDVLAAGQRTLERTLPFSFET